MVDSLIASLMQKVEAGGCVAIVEEPAAGLGLDQDRPALTTR